MTPTSINNKFPFNLARNQVEEKSGEEDGVKPGGKPGEKHGRPAALELQSELGDNCQIVSRTD